MRTFFAARAQKREVLDESILLCGSHRADPGGKLAAAAKAPKCLPPAAFTGQVFHRLAAQVTDAQLENAQIEITRAAVRHFALSADVLALDTTTLNHSQIER
jgi:1,6-anhydro-N-acetylmuramate kinase